MKKRLISLLLAFSMMLTFLPAGAVSAFAEEEELGIKLTDGQKVTKPGTYYLEGTYRKQITFDVEESGTVKVNLKGNVTLDADEKFFIIIKPFCTLKTSKMPKSTVLGVPILVILLFISEEKQRKLPAVRITTSGVVYINLSLFGL